MKCPNNLTVVRHGESAYNALREQKRRSPEYAAFLEAYEARHDDPGRAQTLARQVMRLGSLTLGVGDHDTGLTARGHRQSVATGKHLPRLIEIPDVIFVSPYDRTHGTHAGMVEGWPELAKVPVVEDERLREQEHGLGLLYNDWKLFATLHPDQEALKALEGKYWYRFPQGENVPDVRERGRSWLGAVARDYSGQNVLAVAHHITILSLRANLERLGVQEYIRLDAEERPINCGATIYDGDPDLGRDGRLVLRQYNECLYDLST